MVDIQGILELSDVEKILITEKIWDSIDKNNYQIPQSHKEELDRRIEMIDAGKETFFTWAEVKKDIQKLR
jgi:putative addiction module component (TIGR02574 family)